MTIEHSVTEHHLLNLASADPFGFTYQTAAGRDVSARIDEVAFFLRPNRAPVPSIAGVTLRGRLLRKTGGHGRVVAKWISTADPAAWGQVPEDVKAAMREYGFPAEPK
jgi:hypothetical protein